MTYDELDLREPLESEDYQDCSDFVISSLGEIMREAIDSGRNKIVINTNLKLGIPMENVNKIAGPFVEAWTYEIFAECLKDGENKYDLINVEAGGRLNMADVILQFRKVRRPSSVVTGKLDVKTTSRDIPNSGKSPNITSFARIRSAYVQDPDYIFIVLSIKHRVYSSRDEETSMMMGVMKVVDFNAYDLKFLGDSDLSYNPALGTGQIQVKDIHYVSYQKRTTWEFCKLLDRKFIASRKGFEQWLEYAHQNNWIK